MAMGVVSDCSDHCTYVREYFYSTAFNMHNTLRGTNIELVPAINHDDLHLQFNIQTNLKMLMTSDNIWAKVDENNISKIFPS